MQRTLRRTENLPAFFFICGKGVACCFLKNKNLVLSGRSGICGRSNSPRF
jgi:hypothetical protein